MNNKVWFISDPHFGHENIIKYEDRPFKNKKEMDEFIIENWNKQIKDGHEVFMLGDFSFYGKDRTTEICHLLNGRKNLICGNHDRKSARYYRECGFEEVYKYPIIFDKFLILSHEPQYMNKSSVLFNLHGHTHSNFKQDEFHLNMCVENHGYKPVEFSNVLKLIENFKKTVDT